MTIPEFLDGLIEARIYGGIATKDPTDKNLKDFGLKVVELKRGCGCWIEEDEKFKKTMPFYYQVEELVPMEYAETGRLALHEVSRCCLAAILEDLVKTHGE